MQGWVFAAKIFHSIIPACVVEGLADVLFEQPYLSVSQILIEVTESVEEKNEYGESQVEHLV